LKYLVEFFEEQKKRQEEEKIAHDISERRRKERAREMGFYYFPSFFMSNFQMAPYFIYFNDRTIEGCLDWVAGGRKEIKLENVTRSTTSPTNPTGVTSQTNKED